MSYRLRIKENAKNFTKSNRKIADFLLQKPNEAVFLSTAELGEATETSQAAGIRVMPYINALLWGTKDGGNADFEFEALGAPRRGEV